MSAVVVATSPADFHTAEAVKAVEAVKNHHPWLGGALGVQVEALLEAAARGSLPGTASDALVRWCDAELIPHALAEEQAMYPEAHEDLVPDCWSRPCLPSTSTWSPWLMLFGSPLARCALQPTPRPCGHCSNRTLSRRTSRSCR